MKVVEWNCNRSVKLFAVLPLSVTTILFILSYSDVLKNLFSFLISLCINRFHLFDALPANCILGHCKLYASKKKQIGIKSDAYKI